MKTHYLSIHTLGYYFIPCVSISYLGVPFSYLVFFSYLSFYFIPGVSFSYHCYFLRECVLFIGTRYSNLYTAVDTPAEAQRGCVFVFVCKYVLGRSRATQPLNLRLWLLRHFGFLTLPHAIPTRSGCHPNSFRLLRRSTSGPRPIPRAHFPHLSTSPRLSLCSPLCTCGSPPRSWTSTS
jgi:hypothetical protein